MLKLKRGVVVQGLGTETLLAAVVAQTVYAKHGKDCVITSALDGQHSETSLHYSGNALDLRTRHLDAGQAEAITDDLQDALGDDYDVVLEGNHIHVEYQPKR